MPRERLDPGLIGLDGHPPRRWGTVLLAGLAALSFLAVAVLAADGRDPYGPHESLTVAAQPAALPLPYPTGTIEVAALPQTITEPRLIALAEAIVPGAADQRTGAVQYVLVQQWARDMAEMASRQERNWLHPDGSARTSVRQLPNLPPQVDPDIGRTDFTTVIPVNDTYPAGDFTLMAGSPLPIGEQDLFDRLSSYQSGRLRTVDVITAIAAINMRQTPELAARAAMLRLLARMPGVRAVDDGRDRIGRPGVAVSLTDRGNAYTLLIDRHTGELLAYEQLAVDDAPMLLDLALPAVVAYQLFLDRRRVPSATY